MNCKAQPLEAAAEAAAKVNAMLIAKGKLKVPGNVVSKAKPAGNAKVAGDLFTSEVEINDAPLSARNLLTRGHTQDEVNKYSGAAVSTRGRYMAFDEKGTSTTERPLYLYVQASEKKAVDLAVQRIHEIIQQHVSQQQNRRGNKFAKFNQRKSNGTSQGPPPPPLMSLQTSIPSEKVLVGMEHANPAFDLKSKLIGDDAANLQYISSETGAMVTLRGIGSGFIEPSLGTELPEPLHIFLEHPKLESLQNAKELAENLVETMQQDLNQWEQEQQQQQQLNTFTLQAPVFQPAHLQTVTVGGLSQHTLVAIQQAPLQSQVGQLAAVQQFAPVQQQIIPSALQAPLVAAQPVVQSQNITFSHPDVNINSVHQLPPPDVQQPSQQIQAQSHLALQQVPNGPAQLVMVHQQRPQFQFSQPAPSPAQAPTVLPTSQHIVVNSPQSVALHLPEQNQVPTSQPPTSFVHALVTQPPPMQANIGQQTYVTVAPTHQLVHTTYAFQNNPVQGVQQSNPVVTYPVYRPEPSAVEPLPVPHPHIPHIVPASASNLSQPPTSTAAIMGQKRRFHEDDEEKKAYHAVLHHSLPSLMSLPPPPPPPPPVSPGHPIPAGVVGERSVSGIQTGNLLMPPSSQQPLECDKRLMPPPPPPPPSTAGEQHSTNGEPDPKRSKGLGAYPIGENDMAKDVHQPNVPPGFWSNEKPPPSVLEEFQHAFVPPTYNQFSGRPHSDMSLPAYGASQPAESFSTPVSQPPVNVSLCYNQNGALWMTPQ